MTTTHPSHLSNAELARLLPRLAGEEREASAALVLHLAEFDARRLYEPAGFSSLFKYCRGVLRLTEDATFTRIEVARAVRRYPAIGRMLAAGTLGLTTARLLAPKLTPANHAAVLAAASGKGKSEVEVLLAAFFPQPDVPSSIRRVPTRPAMVPTPAGDPLSPNLAAGSDGALVAAVNDHGAVTASAGVTTPGIANAGSASPGAALPGAEDCGPPSLPPPMSAPLSPVGPPGLAPAAHMSLAAPAPRRALIRPLSPERFEVRFTAGAATCEKLRQAQDLLGHAVPSGDVAEVIDRALTLLVRELSRRKFAETPRPARSPRPSNDPAHIPAAVKRGVAVRDGHRCAYVSPRGHRCGERRFLEYHHVHPRAAGGRATVENIQLRCRSHNGHEVELFFGPHKRHHREDPAPRDVPFRQVAHEAPARVPQVLDPWVDSQPAGSFRNKSARPVIAVDS